MTTTARSNILIAENKQDGWKVMHSRALGKNLIWCNDNSAKEQKRLHVERSKAAPEWADNIPVFSTTEFAALKGCSEEHKAGVFSAMEIFPGSTIMKGDIK